jgi:myo-inositol-1(or 4)-monophosphatase
VSTTADPVRATVDIGYSQRTKIDDFASIQSHLLRLGVNVTQSGSAALGLARVADGRLDGYAERHLYAWDALAGLLLVEEAGGLANPFLEGDGLSAGNETVAATPALYDILAAALGR